jgi:hypothetical protein
MQSIQEAEKLVESRTRIFKQGIGIRWAIAVKENHDYVNGSCGFYSANHAVEIGYDLHLAFWRQGIMTEALEADVDFPYSDNFFPTKSHPGVDLYRPCSLNKVIGRVGFPGSRHT